jgi:hypothetical protein
MTTTVMLALAAVLLLVQAASLIPGLAASWGSSRRQRRTFTGSKVEPIVGYLYEPRRAGCWLLIGPARHEHHPDAPGLWRTCRLPVYRDGLCRWHVAFAARRAA